MKSTDPAFPRPASKVDSMNALAQVPSQAGMSIGDYAAIQFIAAAITTCGHVTPERASEIVSDGIRMAEEFVRLRNVP